MRQCSHAFVKMPASAVGPTACRLVVRLYLSYWSYLEGSSTLGDGTSGDIIRANEHAILPFRANSTAQESVPSAHYGRRSLALDRSGSGILLSSLRVGQDWRSKYPSISGYLVGWSSCTTTPPQWKSSADGHPLHPNRHVLDCTAPRPWAGTRCQDVSTPSSVTLGPFRTPLILMPSYAYANLTPLESFDFDFVFIAMWRGQR